MAESVQTGGIMSFDYSKSGKHKLDNNRKKEIEEAYVEAGERKAKEKRNKIIFWIVIILILIALGIYLLK